MEVEAGHYSSASEIVREALLVWHETQVEKDVAALQAAHAGAAEGDASSEEMTSILEIQKSVRAEMREEARR
jgi:Arc/MetJ-type ribon-helix-helix transcriptional regulator